MRILVDADGTLLQWDEHYSEELDAYGPAAAGIPRWEDRAEFNLFTGCTPEEKKIVNEICARPGFYRNLKPIDGAGEALQRMEAWGHEVFIVTTPWSSNPTCASDKLANIADVFGGRWADRTVITHDKTIVDGDYIIDDKWLIKGANIPRWQHVVFGNRYNAHSVAPYRLEDWEHLELQPWWNPQTVFKY